MTIPPKSLFTVAAVTVAMLAAVACGRSKDEPKSETTTLAADLGPRASCDTRSGGATCTEYRTGASLGLEKALCDGAHGKFSMMACPAAGEVASCVLPDGEVKRYYGGAGAGRAWTLESAKDDCEGDLLKGRFVASAVAASGG